MWSLGSIVIVTIGMIWATWFQNLPMSPAVLPQPETVQQQAKEILPSPPTTRPASLQQQQQQQKQAPPPQIHPPAPHVTAPVGPFYEILEIYPHDSESFTQGLVYDDQQDWIIEGTGNYGESEIRIYNVTTPQQILQRQELSANYFGEGICIFDTTDRTNTNTNTYADTDTTKGDQGAAAAESQQPQRFIIQLEYKIQRGFVYPYHPSEVKTATTTATTTNTMALPVLGPVRQEFAYETTTTEGWGITYNPMEKVFYVTDGSEYIHVWDRDALLFGGNKETTSNNNNSDDNSSSEEDEEEESKTPRRQDSYELRKVKVTFVREATTTTPTSTPPVPLSIRHLNELEWDPSTQTILANLWYQNVIVRIDPNTGQVLMVYDLSQLYTNRIDTTDCLNGIALTGPTTPNEIFVTGKWWPHLYRIRLLR
jgi:glutamine cyclotransferase